MIVAHWLQRRDSRRDFCQRGNSTVDSESDWKFRWSVIAHTVWRLQDVTSMFSRMTVISVTGWERGVNCLLCGLWSNVYCGRAKGFPHQLLWRGERITPVVSGFLTGGGHLDTSDSWNGSRQKLEWWNSIDWFSEMIPLMMKGEMNTPALASF